MTRDAEKRGPREDRPEAPPPSGDGSREPTAADRARARAEIARMAGAFRLLTAYDRGER